MTPVRWNLYELEKRARAYTGPDAAHRREEWRYLILQLRGFADVNNLLPGTFDELVRDSFAELVAQPVAPPAPVAAQAPARELPPVEPEPLPAETPAPVPAPVSLPVTVAVPRGPRLRQALLLVGAAACVVAPVAMVAGLHSPVRVAAALLLLGLAPGAAALPLLGPRAAHVELALVVGTSFACSALVAQIMLWLGAWSPTGATIAVAAASFASIAAQLRPRLA